LFRNELLRTYSVSTYDDDINLDTIDNWSRD